MATSAKEALRAYFKSRVGEEVRVADAKAYAAEKSGASDQTARNALSALVGEKFLDNTRKGYYRHDGSEPSDVIRLPVYGEVGAGPGVVMESPAEYVTYPTDVLYRMTGGIRIGRDEGFVTKVRGTSMLPTLRDGQTIIAQKCDYMVDGGIYVIWLGEDKMDVVKRLQRVGNSRLKVISDNGAYETFLLEHEDGSVYHDVKDGTEWRIEIRGVVRVPEDTSHIRHEAIRAAAEIAREMYQQ